MATISDATKADGYMKSCTKLISFRTPICKPVLDFHASFKHSIGSPEASALIQSLSDARANLVSAYQSSSSYEVKIKCAEEYIPLLYRLIDSINDAQKLQLDKELAFEWQGGITHKGEYFKSSSVLYELLMVFHAKAMYHALAAHHLVSADPIAFVSEAGKHLMEASSVMTLLAVNISSGHWRRQFSRRAPNPPELCEHVCASLALMFKGQAQAMAFMKSASVGSTPATIKSRLAVGVMNSMTGAFNTFCGAPDAVSLYGDFMGHIHITRQLYAALAYEYAARAYLDKTEVGNAIAFCEAAKSRLVQQKSSVRPTWSAPGLPKFVGVHVELGHCVAYMLDSIDQIQKQAEQDNKFVYFQPVPGPNSTNSSAGLPLPDLPPEASVMNPVAYPEPARVEPVAQLVYQAKPSIFSSMISSLVGGSGGKSAAVASTANSDAAAAQSEAVPSPTTAHTADAAVSNTAPPAPSAPPGGVGYSDENYARYLQSQYDAEASSGKGPVPPPESSVPPGPRYNSLV